jgi:hypothetical protein
MNLYFFYEKLNLFNALINNLFDKMKYFLKYIENFIYKKIAMSKRNFLILNSF